MLVEEATWEKSAMFSIMLTFGASRVTKEGPTANNKRKKGNGRLSVLIKKPRENGANCKTSISDLVDRDSTQPMKWLGRFRLRMHILPVHPFSCFQSNILPAAWLAGATKAEAAATRRARRRVRIIVTFWFGNLGR